MRYIPQTRALFAFLMVTLLTALFVPAPPQVVPDDKEQVQDQIERAKIFREAYPVIAEVDLYCSPFIYEGDLPDLKITEAEKGYEKVMFSDADIVHLSQGKQGGLEIGQGFLAMGIGGRHGDFGALR